VLLGLILVGGKNPGSGGDFQKGKHNRQDRALQRAGGLGPDRVLGARCEQRRLTAWLA
jgi:hypothetical protein